jgi:hypothetical protein
MDHALRRRSPRASSQKQRPLSGLVNRKAYSSPASDVDGCCDALEGFQVSPSKAVIVPASSPEGTTSSPPPSSPPVLPATPTTTSPLPESSPLLPTTSPATSPPPTSPPVLATSSTISPLPSSSPVLRETTPDTDMSEASPSQDAEVAKPDFNDDEVMAEDVKTAEPDAEMAEAETRDDDSAEKPDAEMAESKALEDDSAQKPDSEMAEGEAREDDNVQSPREEAMADCPVAVTETTSVVDSKMGDAEDPQKSSTKVEAMVVEPATAVTAPSPAPVSTPAPVVVPEMGFTDDEKLIFERLERVSPHHSKGVAAYEEMLELPWSDVAQMKKVVTFVVKSPKWGKGNLNAAKNNLEGIYTNRQPDTAVVDRLLFTSAMFLRKTDVKPRRLPAPYTCAYESVKGTTATQRNMATVALRKDMGAREELLSREAAIRNMFVQVSLAMQGNFRKGLIPACVSWAELQDIVEGEEYEWHASKVGTTKDRGQRAYAKWVDNFLNLWTNGPRKFQQYFKSKDQVDPLPQPHDSAALKHQAPSVIESAAQRPRIASENPA